MADEVVLREEIEKLEEQTKVLAAELQTVLGIDCSFGACVFDPAMTDIEAKLRISLCPPTASQRTPEGIFTSARYPGLPGERTYPRRGS